MIDINKLTRDISDFANSNRNGEDFNKSMSNEHRTSQQSFTRLCLQWIEHVASDNYKTDGRNECSKKTAIAIIDAFKNNPINYNANPSETMPFI